MKKILILINLFFLLGCMEKTDQRGFYLEGEKIGYNKDTGTLFDKQGFDKNGLNKNGYDKNNVYHKNLYLKTLLNKTIKDMDICASPEEYNSDFFDLVQHFFWEEYSNKNYKPEKEQFEKTEEYNKRLKKYYENKNKERKYFYEKIHTYYKSPYATYDADKEVWIINFPEYFSTYKYFKKYKWDMSFIFPKDFKKTYIYPMKLTQAKQQSSQNIIIKYIFKFSNFKHIGSCFNKNFSEIIYTSSFNGNIIGYQLLINDKIIKEEIFD